MINQGLSSFCQDKVRSRYIWTFFDNAGGGGGGKMHKITLVQQICMQLVVPVPMVTAL